MIQMLSMGTNQEHHKSVQVTPDDFIQIPWDSCFREKLLDITRDKDDIRAIQVRIRKIMGWEVLYRSFGFSFDCKALAVGPNTKDGLFFTKDHEEALSEVHKQARKSSEDAQATEYAQFKKVWAG